MKTFKILILLLLTSSTVVAQQDPLTRLFPIQKTWYNAGYAGFEDGNTLMLTHRQQWIDGLGDNPNVTLMTFDHYFESINSGVGIIAMYDVFGNSETTEGGISYSYRANIMEELKIGIGGQITMFNLESKFSFISADSRVDPAIKNYSGSSININLGSYIKYKAFNTGISIREFNEPIIKDGHFELIYYRHYYWNVQYDWEFSNKITLIPAALYRSVNNSGYFDFNLTALLWERLYGGISYINTDFNEMNFTLGYQFKESITFMVGYVPEDPDLEVGASLEFGLNANF